MDNCIFCKIIAGEIPSTVIYEDEVVKAFLDISQVTPGHTLVIPKKHVKDIFEYDTQLAADVFARIPKIAKALKKFAPDVAGLNIINNNGAVAYQSVFHSHIHLVPRYGKEDGFAMTFANNSADYTPEKLANIAQSIKNNLED